MVCAVPAGTKIASPVDTGTRTRQSSAVPSAIARAKLSRVTFGFKPTSTSAPARARIAYHISVFPRPPAAISCAAAYSSSGCTCTESFSSGKMNFTNRGKSRPVSARVPAHSGGISRQATRNSRPAKGPFANRHSPPVIQASPSGSPRPDFSGKKGARERDPHGRGLKTGSRRAGQTIIDSRRGGVHFDLPKKRAIRLSPSSMRSIEVA